MAAGELALGDMLCLADGGHASIVSVTRERLTSPVDVDNLEVEDFHAYFVAGTGGYCFDTWSGDYYLQARYYDPATRQFLSKDPAEADGEESAYQYCGGDPVQSVDPTGEMADYTGSGRITVANSYANAARQAANKRLRLLLQARAEAAERAERAHRVYVQKLANARIARQKATAAKLRIAKAAAAKKQRIANLKAQTAASQREAEKYAAQAKWWQFASDATVVTAVVAVTWLTAGTTGPIAGSYLVAYGAGGAAATGVGSVVAKELTDGDDMEARLADKVIPIGTKLYRVWGGKSGPNGESWTTVNPNTVSGFRNAAGLPPENTGRFVSEGILKGTSGVFSKTADKIGSNMGGLPEVVVPNAKSAIQLLRVSGANPEF